MSTLPTAKGRLALGVVLSAVGLVLLLDQAGVMDTAGIGRWWPLFVIGIGFVKVRQPIEDGQRAIGTALLFVGSLLQVMAILSFGRGWPLIFVAVGGFLLFQALHNPAVPPVSAPASPFLQEMALIGFMKKSVKMADFKGGAITAVMGGVEMDLRGSSLGPEPAVLDVVTFWGGIDLKVPTEWTVDAQVVPIAGGFENKIQSLSSDSAPRLVIRGYAIMGGIAVGN